MNKIYKKWPLFLLITGLLAFCFLGVYFILKKDKSQCKIGINGQYYHCSFGRSGIISESEKREGDGATPEGIYSLGQEIWYRPDHIKPQSILSKLSKRPIRPEDGWCDDSKKAEYNQYVKLPFDGSHENLWMKPGDHRYDMFVVIEYNTEHPIPGKGSAIFLHIASKNKKGELEPTSGCIALAKEDLLQVLKHIGPKTKIKISKTDGIELINPI